MPEELQGLKSVGNVRTSDVTWRFTRAAAGPGYFLVGDAAMVLDPTSSHGVLRALMSGMQAGHAIAQIIRGEIGELEAARSYNQWVVDWFHHDERRLREAYTLLT
jgi:flavin-dependent dehydrogenase